MNIKDVYKYLDAKYPKDFPILKPKIDEFYQQGIKPDRIYNLMSQYIDLKPYCRALDVQNGDIIEFVKAVKIGTFLRAKFNNEETFSIMQKTLVFEDNNICIFKPKNFPKFMSFGASGINLSAISFITVPTNSSVNCPFCCQGLEVRPIKPPVTPPIPKSVASAGKIRFFLSFFATGVGCALKVTLLIPFDIVNLPFLFITLHFILFI